MKTITFPGLILIGFLFSFEIAYTQPFYQWDKRYKSGDVNFLHSIVHTTGQDYVGCGIKDKDSTQFFTVNNNGIPSAVKVFDNSVQLRKLLKTDGGNIYGVGYRDDGTDVHLYYYIHPGIGITPTLGDYTCYGYDIDTSSSLLAIAGKGRLTAVSSFSPLLYIKTSTTSKHYFLNPSSGYGEARGVKVSSSNDVFVCGMVGWSAFLAKISSSGTIAWSKKFSYGSADEAIDVFEEVNGDILVCGNTSANGSGGTDIFIAKFGSTGTLKWYKTYGTGGNERVHTVQLNSGGKIHLIGNVTGLGKPTPDAIFLEVDTAGILQWCNIYPKVDPYGREGSVGLGFTEINNDSFMLSLQAYHFWDVTAGIIKTDGNGRGYCSNNFLLSTQEYEVDVSNLDLTPNTQSRSPDALYSARPSNVTEYHDCGISQNGEEIFDPPYWDTGSTDCNSCKKKYKYQRITIE